ncbi:MAG TPA: universal stress protein [Geobacteraceae bacterium]|nr:universal stress protein [Geobacteraceae bacterium]
MHKFEKILFALDFSENSEHAFDYAYSLARNYDARLVILHVIQEPVDLSGFYVPHISFEKLEKEIEEGAEKMMEKFCGRIAGDFANYETAIVSGIPYEEILKKAEDDEVSLIVMGTQGRKGIDHLLFGSTAERVVRNARCPVLTVRLP